MADGEWVVESRSGTAEQLHHEPVPRDPGRLVWMMEPTQPALVLGSSQPDRVVDRRAAAAAGVAVIRRRSGGGAVLCEAGGLVWADVLIGAGDPLWDDDVGRASWWVGDAWAAALAKLGHDAITHRGPLVHGSWSDLVCFGSLGPGEVSIGGRKVVGISQRRTPTVARFQCAALLDWRADDLLALLALSDPDRARASGDLGGRATGLGVAPRRLRSAFVAALP